MKAKETKYPNDHQYPDNPFTMDFGREPNEIIPRLRTMDELVTAFTSDKPSQHIAIITGVRGSGKTVFMTSAARAVSDRGNWTAVELSPEQDLLHSLVVKLASPVSDPEVALERMLESIKKHQRRLLITIDEVVNNQNIRVFASVFQILLRRDLPVFLLMTGLFENIRALQNQKTLTFLYRAPRIALEPLNIGIMADSYQRVFSLPRDQAIQMARQTRGYSFAFQLLGYYTWQHRSDPARVRTLFKQHLSEYVYDKIWSEMTAKEREIAAAMAQVPDGSIKSIRSLLNMETNQFNPYRMQLIRKGIANGDTYGKLTFTLPLFEEYVEENA